METLGGEVVRSVGEYGALVLVLLLGNVVFAGIAWALWTALGKRDIAIRESERARIEDARADRAMVERLTVSMQSLERTVSAIQPQSNDLTRELLAIVKEQRRGP